MQTLFSLGLFFYRLRGPRKISVGIIGVGNWGRYGHIPVLRLLPNYEIVAIASRRKEYGKQLAKEFGIPHVFTEPTDLIGHPNVNLVVVVLPPAPQHAALVRAAIAAGKNVYCEWPLTTTLPASTLDASVLDLAHLYAAYANDREAGTHHAPNFADAVRIHRLIDIISKASLTGTRETL